MSIESHLAELERRHEALSREIDQVAGHPSVDTLELAAMKRRKLQLKDQIARLRGSNTIH
jgi:hypothetical protein